MTMAALKWDDLDAPEEALAVVEQKPLVKAIPANERALTMRDELLREAMTTVNDMLRFRDVDPNAEEPPREWLEEGLTEEEAKKRLRVAKGAHLPMNSCPAAIVISSKIALGIISAQSKEGGPPKQLNIQQIFMSSAPPSFPKMEVDK